MEFLPDTDRDNGPKVEGGQDLVVQTVVFEIKIEGTGLGKGQLVAKEVDIQPVFGMTAQFGQYHIIIKVAGLPKVPTWQCEVEFYVPRLYWFFFLFPLNWCSRPFGPFCP